MNYSEATAFARRMARDGWADTRIIEGSPSRSGRRYYMVSAVDPSTGVRCPWIADRTRYDEERRSA